MAMSMGWVRQFRAQGPFRSAAFLNGRGATRAACMLLASAVCTIAALSCGGDSGTGPRTLKAPPPLAVIKFDRKVDSVAIQGTSTIIATFFDSAGSPVVPASTTWSVIDSTIASVSTAGVVTGRQPGSTSVTLKADGVSATLPVVVLPPASRVKVVPGVLDLGVGHAIATQAVSFSASGIVQGIAAGTATLTVNTGTASVSVPISVATLGIGGFRIDLRFIGKVSSTV